MASCSQCKYSGSKVSVSVGVKFRVRVSLFAFVFQSVSFSLFVFFVVGQWEKMLTRGEELREAGQFQEALTVFQQLYKNGETLRRMSPVEEYRLRVSLAKVLLNLSLLAEAAVLLEVATTLVSSPVEAHAQLGVVRSKHGQLSVAMVHYKNCLFYDPGNLNCLHNLGSLLFISGRMNEGLHYLSSAYSEYRSEQLGRDVGREEFDDAEVLKRNPDYTTAFQSFIEVCCPSLIFAFSLFSLSLLLSVFVCLFADVVFPIYII
jgi:tetratricopeptide (TPR) repeat protein